MTTDELGMGGDQQPVWAAAIAELLASEPIVVSESVAHFDGGDALSKAIAAVAAEHESAIARSVQQANAGLEDTISALQRALVARLDID